jgi:hypothetical protein
MEELKANAGCEPSLDAAQRVEQLKRPVDRDALEVHCTFEGDDKRWEREDKYEKRPDRNAGPTDIRA